MRTEPEQSAPPATKAPTPRQRVGMWRTLNRISASISLPRGVNLRPGGGALAVDDFRRFWYGSIISNVGSWMQMVAQGWLILQLTDSAFYLGLVGLVRAVPALTITLIGGVLADRLDRRRLLLFTQTTAGLLAIILGVLDIAGIVTVWQILLLAFLSSIVMAVDNPTRQALVPDLVGTENIASAVGLNSAAWNAAAVIGPSLAGVLVATISTSGAFFLNGLSYVAVVYAVWRIAPRPRQPRARQSILDNLTDGLSFIFKDRRIWGLVVVLAVPTFLAGPYSQFMPIFAKDVLHKGPGGYGLLMGVTGIGSLVGALLVGKFGRSKRNGLALLILTVIFAATLAVFAMSRWFVPALALLLVIGATQTLFMAIGNTLLQLNVPEQMRGRVMSVYSLIPMGLMPLGSMILGSIGAVIGTPITVASGAIIVLAFGLLSFRLFRAVREMP
ncbi:MAG TPA: MFS transporter [Nitrolancea sp.]|nr:MFS transporter [Nitrolancea sp.]